MIAGSEEFKRWERNFIEREPSDLLRIALLRYADGCGQKPGEQIADAIDSLAMDDVEILDSAILRVAAHMLRALARGER